MGRDVLRWDTEVRHISPTQYSEPHDGLLIVGLKTRVGLGKSSYALQNFICNRIFWSSVLSACYNVFRPRDDTHMRRSAYGVCHVCV
jgi:hypothetical protein